MSLLWSKESGSGLPGVRECWGAFRKAELPDQGVDVAGQDNHTQARKAPQGHILETYPNSLKVTQSMMSIKFAVRSMGEQFNRVL